MSYKTVRVMACDFDHTLYEVTKKVRDDVLRLQGEVISELSDGRMTANEARRRCRESFALYGNGRRWLEGSGLNIDPRIYHKKLHDLKNPGLIEPVPGLPSALDAFRKAGGRVAIVTHADSGFLRRAIAHIGIEQMVDYTVTLDSHNYGPDKSLTPAMFNEAARMAGVLPQEVLAAEDALENLEIAFQGEFQTGLVHWGRPPAVLPSWIGGHFRSPVEVVQAATATLV